jgi:hypothetical protein
MVEGRPNSSLDAPVWRARDAQERNVLHRTDAPPGLRRWQDHDPQVSFAGGLLLPPHHSDKYKDRQQYGHDRAPSRNRVRRDPFPEAEDVGNAIERRPFHF